MIMKNVMLKGMLFSVALASSVQMFAQQPEGTLLFRTDDEQFTKDNLVPYMAHRGNPLVGDFNGDGKMDLYQTGTPCYYGWNTKGAPFENMGEGKFVARGGFKWDAENPIIEYAYKYVMVPVYQKDAEGNIIKDNEGNPIPELDENNEPKYEPKKDEEGNPIPELDEEGQPIILKDINGNDSITSVNYNLLSIEPEDVNNPGCVYNYGCMPIDFNQDGLLDYIVIDEGSNGTGREYGSLYILENLGDFHFRMFTCDAFNVVKDGNRYNGWNDNGETHPGINENNKDGIVAVGDYDRDGYPDFIIQSCHYDKTVAGARNVTLFHNERGEGFTVADVFDPMPLEHEYCMARIYEKTEDTPDPDDPTGETIIPGVYTDKPNYKPRSLRSSNLVMGDFNGDGWLDIIIGGWYDGDNGNAADPYVDKLGGGWGIAFYQNTKDGRFKDVTHTMIPLAGEVLANAGLEVKGTIEDVKQAYSNQNATFVPVDWDQNGVLDLFMNMNARGERLSIVLLGIEGEDLAFEEIQSGVPSVDSQHERTKLFADMNGDDVMDIMMFGWSKYNRPGDGSSFENWASMFMSSNGTPGDYTFINMEDDDRPEDERYNIGFYRNDAGMSYGDLNNDGLIDAMTQVWGNGFVTGDGTKNLDGTPKQSNEHLVVSFNETPGALDYLAAPEAPEDVEAREVEGQQGAIEVTWGDNSELQTGRLAMYNLYIKNKVTGKTFMLVPASMENGAQFSYMPFGSYVLSGSNYEPSYTYVNIPNGDYKIGVQAVNYAYWGSAFTTCDITVKNGVSGVKSATAFAMDVKVEGNTVTVSSTQEGEVSVYGTSGSLVATGRTNEGITVNGKGVFVVNVNGQSVKIVK